MLRNYCIDSCPDLSLRKMTLLELLANVKIECVQDKYSIFPVFERPYSLEAGGHVSPNILFEICQLLYNYP